ncbi:MAG: hypothetical protein HGA27_04435 [Peptococcaceae bacterium]|nr:hypothetical protein [Peptococcaceae bacterium]
MLRGRTVRSLALLLNKVKSTKLYFVAPKTFQIKDDILSQLDIDYEITDNFDSVLSEVDVVYMTRLQDEYGGTDEIIDTSKYCINSSNIEKLKGKAIILHPLPRREEISIDVDKNHRAKFWEQCENGMWVRVALLIKLFEPSFKLG